MKESSEDETEWRSGDIVRWDHFGYPYTVLVSRFMGPWPSWWEDSPWQWIVLHSDGKIDVLLEHTLEQEEIYDVV